MMEISKKHFSLLNELIRDLPWLKIDNRIEATKQLLFSECKSEDERLLVKNLLMNFEYVDNKGQFVLMNQLLEKIIGTHGVTPDNLKIVAAAVDSSPDSSQWLTYNLKELIVKKGRQWDKKGLILNSVSSVVKSITRAKNNGQTIEYVFIVDEFIGSGSTMINRVKHIKYGLTQSSKVPMPNISVISLVSMEQGLENINNASINADSILCIKKGISDYWEGREKDIRIAQMVEIEQKLASHYRKVSLPSLGYDKAEALYFRETGNVPNNVFPIFWWPLSSCNTERQCLFIRAMEGDS